MNYINKFRKNPKRLYLTYRCLRRFGVEHASSFEDATACKTDAATGGATGFDGGDLLCVEQEKSDVAFCGVDTFVDECENPFVCEVETVENVSCGSENNKGLICDANGKACNDCTDGKLEKGSGRFCKSKSVKGVLILDKKRKMLMCDVLCCHVGFCVLICTVLKLKRTFKR